MSDDYQQIVVLEARIHALESAHNELAAVVGILDDTLGSMAVAVEVLFSPPPGGPGAGLAFMEDLNRRAAARDTLRDLAAKITEARAAAAEATSDAS